MSTPSRPTVDPTDPLIPPTPATRASYLRYWLPALRVTAEKHRRSELTEAHGLSDDQVDRMLGWYATREMHRSPHARRRTRGEDWVYWSGLVTRISVDLKPGGRAVLRDPDVQYRVEIRFVRKGTRVQAITPKTVQIIADQSLSTMLPDLYAYHAAFFVRLVGIDPKARKRFVLAPPTAPEPGKPPKIDFYKQLVATYDQLMAGNERNPIGVLAEQMDKPKGTVKSWLSRGRKYLATEKGD